MMIIKKPQNVLHFLTFTILLQLSEFVVFDTTTTTNNLPQYQAARGQHS